MSGRGKIIKPPMEEIARGKVFKPSKYFRNKNWFLGIFSAIMLWVTVVGSMLLVFWLVELVSGATGYLMLIWIPFNFWFWLITLSVLIPYLIVYPIYIRSFEYSVVGKSGETMPEIYVKKGIINITRKHVPFRTITNIQSVAGPFDRLFGIGSIEVETASGSGSALQSAEEKLEGLTFYEELRDFILMELRKFKDPYVTGTEVVHPEEDEVIRVGTGDIEDEILMVLREIRDLLRRNRE
ncbi:MAG: PH domain-containing protein [Candidatus Thorarchaeota archaeon]|jgi:membrane protein YdbS with pleckstrin-like domain